MSITAFRWVAWSFVAACLGILVVVGGFGRGSPSSDRNADATSAAKIGAPFSMTAHTGETVTDQTFAGKGWLVFVGFTNCPEICPTTLTEMSSWFKALGPEADMLRGFLVSVDPERDTLESLKLYMSSFDPRIVALRPEPAELASFAKAFKVYYAKVPTSDGGYTMDHTAGVLLFDREGKFSGTIDLHEDRDVAIQKIRRLIN